MNGFFSKSFQSQKIACKVSFNKLNNFPKTQQSPRKGFSLIEFIIVLLIFSAILMLGVEEYLKHVEYAKDNRANADLEELAKQVRYYNVREKEPFNVGTFTLSFLGTFVGKYLEKEPPFDPWGHPYRHNSQMGILYSIGKDGIDQSIERAASGSDDIVVRYLPEQFFISKAEYCDENQNNLIDYGDFIELTLSRPARMDGVEVFDFVTGQPPRALGSAIISSNPIGTSLRIVFSPPIMPNIILGRTTISPRLFISSIYDFSKPPEYLQTIGDVIIFKKKE